MTAGWNDQPGYFARSTEHQGPKGAEASKAICMAAWNNNLRVLQGLVEQQRQGGSASSLLGYGPLHFAASLGNVDILNFLLESGLDMNARDKDGSSPLMWIVASDGDMELMEALVDHGADVNVQNFVGETALFVAAQRGLFDKVEYLLENGANVHITNLDGATALHAAAANGCEDIVLCLIKYGAHLNIRDDEGDTPLHWAVREGNLEATRMLLNCGTNIDATNNDDETPLSLAICCEDQSMIKCLISAGASSAHGGYSFAAAYDKRNHLSDFVGMELDISEEMGRLSFAAAQKAESLEAGKSPFASNLAAASAVYL